MISEQELKRVADLYSVQGYQMILQPRPDDLPPFAKDFEVELMGKRGGESILVAVKKNRDEAAADSNMPRYAEITGAQPGWRFDFVILESDSSMGREGRGVREFSGDGIGNLLTDAGQMIRMGFLPSALVIAWAGLEAAMRMRLRAAGERAGWGTMPRVMLNELYSSGILSMNEFRRLESIFQFRNEIAHGFASPALDPDAVQFLSEIARRLVVESQQEKQPA